MREPPLLPPLPLQLFPIQTAVGRMFLTHTPLECVRGGGALKHCTQMVLCLGEGSQLPSDLQRHPGFLKHTETAPWGVRARLAGSCPPPPLQAEGTKMEWPQEVERRNLKSSPHRGGVGRTGEQLGPGQGGFQGGSETLLSEQAQRPPQPPGRAPGCAFLRAGLNPPFCLPCL